MIRPTADAVSVAAAQLILNRNGASLVVDGKFGRKSAQALSLAEPSVRESIKTLVQQVGGKALQPLSPSTMVNREQIVELIRSTAAAHGVPVKTALAIAWLESKFDPNAVSSTGAKGVYQMTSIAVRDVATRGQPRVDIKGREMDPGLNVLAGILYIKLVSSTMGVPLSDIPRIYMGFNIGPTGARQVLSGRPEAAADAISKQAYGAPSVYEANLRKAVAQATAATSQIAQIA